MQKGHELRNIERVLQSGVNVNGYSEEDVLIVINKVMKEKLSDNGEVKEELTITEIQENQEKLDQAFLDNFEDEEKVFLSFLMEFPEHNYSTVELYKNMGFSARKGNTIKLKLQDRGVIRVEEQKSKTGWKKFIRLNNSLGQEANQESYLTLNKQQTQTNIN
jgi:hypothetical protein